MDLNDVTTLHVLDLEVDVRMEWGELRKLIRGVSGATAENAGKVFDSITDTLKNYVVDVRGLTKAGKPVAWEATIVDKLPPVVVQGIVTALLTIGDQKQAGDPLVTSKT